MRILVQHDEQRLGPWSFGQAKAALAEGTVRESDLAWVEGSPDWVPLSAILATPELMAPAPGPFSGGASMNSGLAITSLVLAICSFVLCLWAIASVPAVICGHIALVQIKRSQGALRGSGLAVGGLVTGYLNLALFAAMAFVVVPMLKHYKGFGREGQLEMNAAMISQGISNYAEQHHGTYPNDLEELVPQYVQSHKMLESPYDQTSGEVAFHYYLAGQTNPKPDALLLASKRVNRLGFRLVVFADGESIFEKRELDDDRPRLK